jgi:hypothetical protein
MVSPERRGRLITELEAMATLREQEIGHRVTPEGAWIGPRKDTICTYDDGVLAAAAVIQRLALVDPLILHPDAEHKARLIEKTVFTAQGVLLAQGDDEFHCAVAEDYSERWMRHVEDYGHPIFPPEQPIILYRIPL